MVKTVDSQEKFWETKTLGQMSQEEWESLCDGCAKCCQIKYQHPRTNELAVTQVVCELLDLDTCKCTNYENRHKLIDECIELTPRGIPDLYWLPSTCAYRLVTEKKPLFDWHPLVSGDENSVHDAGISVRGSVISEKDVHPDDIESQYVKWVDK